MNNAYQSVSFKDYIGFRAAYRRGVYKGLRYGQAFMNAVLPDMVDPEVYYEKSEHNADALILERYVNLEYAGE